MCVTVRGGGSNGDGLAVCNFSVVYVHDTSSSHLTHLSDDVHLDQ